MNTQSNKKNGFLDNPAILFFLILPYVKPASLGYIAPELEHLFDIIKIFSFVIILALYVYNFKLSKMILCISFYELSLFISTFINNGDYWKLAVSCGTVISFSMLVEMCVKNNSKVFFKCFFDIYFFLVTINFILIIVYPDGLARDDYYGNSYHFIHIRNGLPPILIPIMAITCIHCAFENSQKKLTFKGWVMLALISATILITWSATGVVGWFIVMAYVFFVYKGKITGLFNSKRLLLLNVLMQVFIVFLRLQNIFSFIIENILGRSLTLTGRTEIWDLSMIMIKRSPIIGYGVYEGHGFIFWRNKFYYSHNMILEIMLQGGAVALTAFIVIIIIAGVSLYRYRTHYISEIIAATMFSVFVMMITEAYISSILLYGIIIISTCVPDIISQLEKRSETEKHTAGSQRYKYIMYRIQK